MKLKEGFVRLKSLEDKDIAKFIFNYFQAQYEYSVIENIKSIHELEGMQKSNREADKERERDNDVIGWENHPYSSSKIEMAKKNLDETFKNKEEAKSVLDFIKERLIS